MKVRELLTNKGKWCQGHDALDKHGIFMPPCNRKAIQWCVGGAIQKCYSSDIRQKIYMRIQSKVGGNISKWNDDPERTFADVKKLIEELNI